jgi:DNA (cytosine-5)-methyltransferase 1
MKHFDLCAGIGGFSIAAEKAGFETTWFCEIDDKPAARFQRHFPKAKRVKDIAHVNRLIVEDEFTLVTAGFPCQPYSQAGKQRGAADDRDKWPEVFRVVDEFRPAWFVGENVDGFINLGLERTASDLESIGYQVQPFSIPACAVGAPHQRKRTFIAAYADKFDDYDPRYGASAVRGQQFETSVIRRCTSSDPESARLEAHRHRSGEEEEFARPLNLRLDVADASRECTYGGGNIGPRGRGEFADGGWWAVEPPVGRVVDGFPGRVDRIKMLGNALVWQQVFPILKMIAIIEEEARLYAL